MYKSIAKASSEKDLQAYLGNVGEQDHTRTSVKSYAEDAADLASALVETTSEFPELFQLSYKWPVLYRTASSLLNRKSR